MRPSARARARQMAASRVGARTRALVTLTPDGSRRRPVEVARLGDDERQTFGGREVAHREQDIAVVHRLL